jgi:hypothetical protein
VWTWDFVSDITTRGGGFRTLVLIDEHMKQCVAHHVARRIAAEDVMAVLAKAIESYGAPEHIRSDNGPRVYRPYRPGRPCQPRHPHAHHRPRLALAERGHRKL